MIYCVRNCYLLLTSRYITYLILPGNHLLYSMSKKTLGNLKTLLNLELNLKANVSNGLPNVCLFLYNPYNILAKRCMLPKIHICNISGGN